MKVLVPFRANSSSPLDPDGERLFDGSSHGELVRKT